MILRGVKMIAEIHGKISKTGSNLSDRLEDELTGNIFGTLRYIPFSQALQPILAKAVYPSSISEKILQIDKDEWNENIQFWPYDKEGELDVYIEFDEVAIGIEVKYCSGLSSDDDVDYSVPDCEYETINSCNQLQREAKIISKKSIAKQKILLLIASAKDCVEIYENIQKRQLLSKYDVAFGYISWQSFLREIRYLKSDNIFNNIIVNDLINLLAKKGFNQFNSMSLNCDYNIKGDSFYEFR